MKGNVTLIKKISRRHRNKRLAEWLQTIINKKKLTIENTKLK
jgi:hypothetical protein